MFKATVLVLTFVFKGINCRGDSSFWVDVGVDFGYAALITLCLLIVACFLAMAACYICIGQRSRGRIVSFREANQVLVQSLARPAWTLTVTSDPELSSHGFSFIGNGMTIVDQNTVERARSRKPITAGAKWSRGVSRGKHVYEVIWPEVSRGIAASVGVGCVTAPLFIKGKVTLVGMTTASWGFDIAKKRIYHNSSPIAKCPPNEDDPVPERFLMYVDMDRGELGFGSMTEYWGVMAENIHFLNQSLYVMVGASVSRARVQVFYRGSVTSSAMRHPPPGSVATSSLRHPPPAPLTATPSMFPSPCSTPDSTRHEDLELHKRATYQAIGAARVRQITGRAQAWSEESANLTPPPRESTFQHPLSPPPPYSRY